MSAPSQHTRKRDKFLNLFRSSSPDLKIKSKSAKPKDVKRASIASNDTTCLYHLSTVSTSTSIIGTAAESAQGSVETEHAINSISAKSLASVVQSSTPWTKPRLD
ncbi:hypothetical protein BGW39_002538, partial [Mortierella sp. 14UC]